MPVECLTVRLGGLSKSAGLPQVKLGWLAVDGPDAARRPDALQHLELIADTYLSVSTPVQVAAPALIASGAVRARRRSSSACAATTRALARAQSQRILRSKCWRGRRLVGGRCACRRVGPEEELAIALLEDDDVLVHPGLLLRLRRTSVTWC